jgi:hypothetical protein
VRIYLWIVNEGSISLSAGWKLARSGILETFDNGLRYISIFILVQYECGHTVLPEPLHPTMRVRGVLNFMAARY